MYPRKHQTEVFLLALSMLLLFAPYGIAQPEATSSQPQQSSDDIKSQSQSTSTGPSDLTPSTAIESTNQYTDDTIAAPLKAHKAHNEHNLGQEKTDSTSQSSLKGYIRKFQQYQQTLPEGAVTQQQAPTRQNFVAPDYSQLPSQLQQPQFQTQNGYLQQQVPYPDQYAPYAVPQPGFYDPNQYPRYVQPAPGNVNQNRFPRVSPWRFFGGCF